MSSSMKAARSTRTRISMKFRAYSISHRNLMLEDSEEILNVKTIDRTVHLPHGRDQYCLMIKQSSGQKQKYVFTQIPYNTGER